MPERDNQPIGRDEDGLSPWPVAWGVCLIGREEGATWPEMKRVLRSEFRARGWKPPKDWAAFVSRGKITEAQLQRRGDALRARLEVARVWDVPLVLVDS